MMQSSVDLTLVDGALKVSPFPDDLKQKMRYWKRELKWNPETHRRDVVGHYESLWFDDGEDLFVMPGHTHRVCEYFRQLGIAINFEDKRTPFPDPDVDRAFNGLREYQKEIVLKMLAARGGIMHLSTGLGKTFCSSRIIDAYDPEELKIRGTPICVFAAPSKDITRKNYEEFVNILPHRDVGLVMSGVKKFSDDIQVITLDSLHLLDPERVGILVVDEMHTAASDSRVAELLKFRKALRYGVSATPSGRFDGKDIVAEGIFGPVVVTKNYRDGVECGALVPIEVCWINCPEPAVGMKRYLGYKTRQGKVGAGSIGNYNQNRLIANILDMVPESQQTLVITQFIEHMHNIHRLCKEPVEYVHAQTTSEGLAKYPGIRAISTKERKEIYERVMSGDIRKVISTLIYATGVNFPGLNVVINAAGGGSDIAAAQIPGRASRKTDGKDKAYMVEFWHGWDLDGTRNGPLLSADKQRRKVYTDLGFTQTWIQPDQLETLPFLRD